MPDEETLAKIFGLPTPAERARDRAIYEATLKEIVLGPESRRAGPSLLRALVEDDAWFVPIRPDGSLEMVEVEEGRYRPAIEPEPDGTPKKKRGKGGKGGRLLPVYAEEPDRPSTPLDGRTLVRTLPEDLDGLLLHTDNCSPRELGREHFTDLLSLADSCDLEDLLTSPGPDQVEPLKRATWWVPMSNDRLGLDDTTDGAVVVSAYTHPDRVGYSKYRIVPLRGEELFQRVAADDQLDGIIVNPISLIGRGKKTLNRLLLSPGILLALLAGEDLREGVRPLPARTRGEVELWLELRRFRFTGQELLEAPYPDESLFRATTDDRLARQWRMQETAGNQRPGEEKVWSPVFVVPAAGRGDPGLGEGPTRILCAGLLARELNAGRHDSKDPERCWRPGRWLLVGRFVEGWERKRSERRLVLATELAKLLPPGADRVPRSALLTVEGATLLRQRPHAGSRAWIEATLRQAERYASPWVWGG